MNPAPAPQSDAVPLGLADVPSYARALAEKPEAPATKVSFRDLWNQAGAHQGKRVEVEGTVERVFHQPKVGELPALAETWIVAASQDPFCLVFPDAEVPLGSKIRFQGTFLRQLRYAGADVDRVAPLIVGPTAPRSIGPAPATGSGREPALDLMFGLVVLLIVATGLGRAFLRRPRASSRPDVDPPPVFQDGFPE